MRESVKTALFCAVAAALGLAAALVEPGTSTPAIFSDQGELLFPRRQLLEAGPVEPLLGQSVAGGLSADEKQKLIHWVRSGMEMGDAAKLPPPPSARPAWPPCTTPCSAGRSALRSFPIR